jgi:hypothetical protein
LKKASGSDGTLQVLSRNLGWITVKADTMDRNKRLGKNGPFDKQQKKFDLRNSSDIAPSWMQCQFSHPKLPPATQIPAHYPMRGASKVTYLYEKSQPERSVFNIGDMRHNITERVNVTKAPQTFRNLYEWERTVDTHRVTSKVGQRDSL